MICLHRRLARLSFNNHARHFCAPPKSAEPSHIEPIEMARNVFNGPNTDKSVPPLFIMHGLFGSKQNWRGVSKALTQKTNREIYAVDARNHGDSPHTDLHNSMCLATDVVHLADKLGLKKICVMGHSMGGRGMMYLSLKYPQLVDRMIVIDISPIALPRDFATMESVFKALRSVQIPPEMSMAEARRFAKVEMDKLVEVHETVEFILLNLRKNPDGSFKWAMNVDGLYNNLRDFGNFLQNIAGLPPYQGPVMFICGTLSKFVDPNSWPQIQKIFPKAEVHWLNAGHLVHFDQPQKFIELLSDFLK